MDTFIDKLAEKLNAQEIINANRAADTEELARLRNQLKEYEKCLDQLGQINQSIRASLAGMNQEYQDKTKSISQSMQVIAESNSRKLEEQMLQLSAAAVRRINEAGMNPSQIDRLVVESLDKIRELSPDQEVLEKLQQSVEEGRQAVEQLQKNAEHQAAVSNEFVHKENVKVYRNVQAVVMEESARQTESLNNLAGSLEELKEQEAAGRSQNGLIKGVLGVSVAAMLLSAGSLVFQLLVYFHIL